jgi:uncharacterized membrane protein
MTFVNRGHTTLLSRDNRNTRLANQAPGLQIVPNGIGQPIVMLPNREAMVRALAQAALYLHTAKLWPWFRLVESFKI